ncbi:unnamed protein product [Symbiodinium sp. CCMP2592]|nr:unnamed protein product [Symbiodinium sp. CCMP2592]
MDAPEPDRGPEILPRPRGIRAGKSAVRKRKAYQQYQLSLQPFRYTSLDDVPIRHQDGSQRPLYTRAGWKPIFESDSEPEEELVEVEVEAEETPLIPKASGAVPEYHRIRVPPAPPAPPVRRHLRPHRVQQRKHLLKVQRRKHPFEVQRRKHLLQCLLLQLQFLDNGLITPAAKSAAVPKVSVSTPSASPPDPKITAPKTPPKNPPKPPASRPSQVAVIPKVPPKSALTTDPVVDLPRSVLLYSPDTFNRCNFRVEDSQRLEGKVVVFDFHNVIDRYYWAPRIGQRKQQYKIPYPNEAPELLSDVQGLLRRVHRAAEEAGALVVICSHISEGSRSIEDWALDTLRNTFIQSVGQRQADLVIITRSRTGHLGKLDICRRLFQRPSLLIIDDNTGICDEWNRSANAAAFHIQLPRRELPSVGRSFSSIFEAEPSILNWISG